MGAAEEADKAPAAKPTTAAAAPAAALAVDGGGARKDGGANEKKNLQGSIRFGASGAKRPCVGFHTDDATSIRGGGGELARWQLPPPPPVGFLSVLSAPASSSFLSGPSKSTRSDPSLGVGTREELLD